ncbi:MAG: hypothetical protein K6G04_02325 [Lachnospiraceae bacterium]|nr:hypothetical protein [Lachnospiraceae bacterium]
MSNKAVSILYYATAICALIGGVLIRHQQDRNVFVLVLAVAALFVALGTASLIKGRAEWRRDQERCAKQKVNE